jgi:hypothetical protein
MLRNTRHVRNSHSRLQGGCENASSGGGCVVEQFAVPLSLVHMQVNRGNVHVAAVACARAPQANIGCAARLNAGLSPASHWQSVPGRHHGITTCLILPRLPPCLRATGITTIKYEPTLTFSAANGARGCCSLPETQCKSVTHWPSCFAWLPIHLHCAFTRHWRFHGCLAQGSIGQGPFIDLGGTRPREVAAPASSHVPCQ